MLTDLLYSKEWRLILMTGGQIAFIIIGVTAFYLVASLAFDAIGKWRVKHSKNSEEDDPHGKEK